MAFVLDASVAACWAFADEKHPAAAQALTRIRLEGAAAPTLFWFEIRNILVVNERRGRLTKADTTDFLRSLSKLPVAIDGSSNEAQVLHLARSNGLTVYDAAYLELAQRTGSELATLDTALIRAARAEGIRLMGR